MARRLLKFFASFGGIGAFMMQVGPLDAASNISKWYALIGTPPEWLTAKRIEEVGTWIFGSIALASSLALMILWLVNRCRLISLEEAARMVFEKTQHSAHAAFYEGFRQNPGGILRGYAKLLLTNNKNGTYGQFLPSTKRTLVHVDPSDLAEDCRSIKSEEGVITHSSLAVRRSAIDSLAKIINRNDKFVED